MPIDYLEAMLRGGAMTAAAILGLLFARRGLDTPIGLFGFLQGIATLAFLSCSAPWLVKASPLWWTLTTLCHFTPLAFWLFARAIFNDIDCVRPLEKRVCGAYLLLVVAYVWSLAVEPTALSEAVEDLFRLTALGFGLYVMFDVIREYGNDLIERRRKVRLYLVGSVGTLFVVLVVYNIVTSGARPHGISAMFFNGMLILLSGGLALMITRLRRDLFPLGAPAGAQASAAASLPIETSAAAPDLDRPNIDARDIDAVLVAMEKDHAYRDETLTVATFAARLDTQEYKLRRVINQGLGQRNFTKFVNGYRLTEIEAALRDPAQVKTPILTLALSAGFGSIGPFNRAFKDKHGITPRAFRQQHHATTAETP